MNKWIDRNKKEREIINPVYSMFSKEKKIWRIFELKYENVEFLRSAQTNSKWLKVSSLYIFLCLSTCFIIKIYYCYFSYNKCYCFLYCCHFRLLAVVFDNSMFQCWIFIKNYVTKILNLWNNERFFILLSDTEQTVIIGKSWYY